MSAAENIEKLVKKFCASKKSYVNTSREMDKKLLDDAWAAYEKSKKTKSAQKQPITWRLIMKSKITKLSAAALILIAVLIGVHHFGSSIDGTSVAYGMEDLLVILKQAQTIQITGWGYLNDHATVADNKSERDISNCYIDNLHERLRWSGYGFDTTIDGQIMTKINHHDKSVIFYKLSDFQRMVWLRKMHDWHFDSAFMSEEELSEFVKVRNETIDGSGFDVWERTTSWSYPSDREIKLKVWMSPTTGEVRRIEKWQRGGFTNGKWCITQARTIKINRAFELGAFDPEIPDRYHMMNTKEDAPEYRFLINAFYANGKRSEIRYIFTLENGSVIMAWSAGITLSDNESVALYEVLEPGQSMPTKPVEILYGLTPRGGPKYDGTDWDVTFEDTGFTYNERFLACTVKDAQLYEWAIYVPNIKISLREALRRCEIVIGMDPENPTWKGVERSSLYNNSIVIYDVDFNTFFLGAMEELSDEGIAPEHITYDNVINLAKKIRAMTGE